MHQVLIMFTVTFMQGSTDHTYENNKYSVISETLQAMPSNLAMPEIVEQACLSQIDCGHLVLLMMPARASVGRKG